MSKFIFYSQPNADTFQVFDSTGADITHEVQVESHRKGLQIIINGLIYLLRRDTVDKIIGRSVYIKTNGVDRPKIVETISEGLHTTKVLETRAIQVKMDDFDPQLFQSILTGIPVLDQFFSRRGGIPKARNIMIAGEPGCMKTSLMLHILNEAKKSNPDKQMLYISAGEMRSDEVADIARYYPGLLENVHLLFANQAILRGEQFHKVVEAELETGYDIVVIDSWAALSDIVSDELSVRGKGAETWFLRILDKNNMAHNKAKKFTTFLIIQQVTKGGVFAGSNYLKHMTQAFAYLRRDDKQKGKTYMVYEKNRVGDEHVKLYYFKKEDGIGFDSERYKLETDLMKIDSIPETKTSKADFMKSLHDAAIARQEEEFYNED
jgi:predicted ATP-dependent serine protease